MARVQGAGLKAAEERRCAVDAPRPPALDPPVDGGARGGLQRQHALLAALQERQDADPAIGHVVRPQGQGLAHAGARAPEEAQQRLVADAAGAAAAARGQEAANVLLGEGVGG